LRMNRIVTLSALFLSGLRPEAEKMTFRGRLVQNSSTFAARPYGSSHCFVPGTGL
jgi:hypothetical protein